MPTPDRRQPLTALQAVDRLGGLQAQATPSPYLSLWTRLDGFERDELTAALTRRRLVKALLQRGTLHVVTPRQYWAIMAVRRGLAASLWPASYEARLPAARIAEIAELVLAELRGNELTFKEVGALLEPHACEGVPPTFLWRRVQGHSCVVHVPPSGIWGYGGHGVYTAAAGKVRGARPEPEEAFARIVRQSLRTFADGHGKVLYDLPRAPLPDPETPRPHGSCRASTTSSSRTPTVRESSATCSRRGS